jgi:hypothetical protein
MVKPFLVSHPGPTIGTYKNSILSNPPTPLLTQEEIRMLTQFIQTMDSLEQVDKKTFKQALRGREGMMDSIRFMLDQVQRTKINQRKNKIENL